MVLSNRLLTHLLVLPLVLIEHLLHHSALKHKLVLELGLLCLGQLGQFLNNILPVFKAKVPNYFSCFPISLCLGHVIVLLSHVHVPGSVRRIHFAAVVQARKLFLEVTGAPPYVLFS